ncbi:MAG: HlyD family efflux transporter periplasmic adaptor subunit, partial [Thermoleophilaceae bacterium]|nr:HlyD family efflux transporter periplasmic adaptor subunit [Thermoleophilaceae bacterium]
APSAGVVHNVLHAARDRVAAGEPLARVRGADGSLETVRSPSTGQLIEVSANRGDYVAAGAPLALVDPVTQPLVVYAYLPQDDAKEARVGDRVEITISEAEPAQFGFLLGRVAAIGAYPATPDRLRSILQDQSVLAEVDQLGPVVETLVHPDPDPSTPSGFRWSQGEGPPYRLTVGTAASVSVVTGQRAPIDYVTG